MSTTEEHDSPSPDDGPGDADFDLVLRALARPPELAQAANAHAPRELSALEGALQRALGEAQAPRAEPRIGAVLDGRYRVNAVLGRGGMGVVLGAEHLHTGKSVALKWMSLGAGPYEGSAAVARFRREMRAVAKIQHENVVDVFDAGDSDGTPFLVMERLSGESLRARIARGALSWAEARGIITGVLHGVAEVHRAGVVHRDLKPDNIYLCTRPGAAPLPKVLDFGVASVRNGSADGLGSLTCTGAMVGTPAYMAIEQLTSGEVDARTDVYAVGVVLYEMLTRRLPFAARSAADLAVLQATERPAPPSQLVPGLPGRVDRLLLKALARRPEDRFADASAFAEALVSEQREPRLRVAALVLGVVALVLGLGFAALHERPRAAPAGTTREPGNGAPVVSAPRDALPEWKEPSRALGRELGQEPTPAAPLPVPLAPPARRTTPRRARAKPPVMAAPAPSPAAASPDAEPTRRDRTAIRVDDF